MALENGCTCGVGGFPTRADRVDLERDRFNDVE